MELTDRKKRLLAAIVEAFIQTGEPVGSKTLAQRSSMGLSSATLRNEMSELSEMGLLEQPHTSAGRVPSQAGYRLYVDSLMRKRHLGNEEIAQINRLLDIREGDMESVLAQSGRILAEITGCATLSTAPCDRGTQLKRVEIVPAGRQSVLLILLTDSGIIRSRLCRAGEELSPEMLGFFAKLAEDRLAGKPLDAVTPALMEDVGSQLFEYTCALAPLLDAITEETRALMGSEVYLRGESNLVSRTDLDSENLHGLLRLLEHTDILRALVDGAKNSVEIRIGTENGIRFMDDTSVITAPYAFLGKTAGAIGIIGPKRMDYARMVPSLEYFSAVLGEFISNIFGSL